jgi:hypothetical protein
MLDSGKALLDFAAKNNISAGIVVFKSQSWETAVSFSRSRSHARLIRGFYAPDFQRLAAGARNQACRMHLADHHAPLT